MRLSGRQPAPRRRPHALSGAWNLFSPWVALAVGVLIGLATALHLLGNGRVAGISGILERLLAAPQARARCSRCVTCWLEGQAMNALIAAFSGLVFGVGLIASGMTDPAKVKGFLDLAGAWDPSLGLVMGGGNSQAAFFVLAMVAGVVLHDRVLRRPS